MSAFFGQGVLRKAADYGGPLSKAIFHKGHFCIEQISRQTVFSPS